MLKYVWAVSALMSLIMTGTGLTGCDGGARDFTGKWVGTKQVPNQEKMPPAIRNTITTIELQMDADGKFTLIDSGIPYAGVYSTQGRKAILKIRTMMNRTIAPTDDEASRLNVPVTIEFDAEDKVWLKDAGGFYPDAVEMRRVGSSARPSETNPP